MTTLTRYLPEISHDDNPIRGPREGRTLARMTPNRAPTRYRRDTDRLQPGSLAHPEPRHDH